MSEVRSIKLFAAAKSLNIGTGVIVDFLATKGYKIQKNPATQLDSNMYLALLKEFAVDKILKEDAKQISIENIRKEEPAPFEHRRSRDFENEEILIKNTGHHYSLPQSLAVELSLASNEKSTSIMLGNKIPKEQKSSFVTKQCVKIFLASSSELKEEREKFEIFIGRENKRLHEKGLFLRLDIWEDFLDAISQSRLQDEYNLAINNCDIFVMLFFTKVGKYTAEEFEKAFRHFKKTNSPKIYTYFKTGDIKTNTIDRDNTKSLWNFQDKLKELGHFQTEFHSNADLHLHFKNQLERLYDF